MAFVDLPKSSEFDPGPETFRPAPIPICCGCLHFDVCKWSELVLRGPATITGCSKRTDAEEFYGSERKRREGFAEGVDHAARWLTTSKAEKVIDEALETDDSMHEALARAVRNIQPEGSPP